MASSAQQRQWESILRPSERKEFPEFRQLMLTLRGGLSPEEFVKRLAEKPAFEEMYEVCLAESILKPRGIPKAGGYA